LPDQTCGRPRLPNPAREAHVSGISTLEFGFAIVDIEETLPLVDDAMLDTYAVISTYDEIAEKLRARYSGLATHLEFTMALATPGEVDALRAILAELKRP